MNKIIKVLLAFIGAVDLAFNIFIPISISLLIVSLIKLGSFTSFILLTAGIISSLYRGIKIVTLE